MRLLATALAFAALSVTTPLRAAEPLWLTIMGDPTRQDVETVQVMADSVSLEGAIGSLRLRVSRTQSREGYDGQNYRSYVGWIKVNCPRREGRFQQLQFYSEPLWTGEVRVANYTDPNMPQLQFKDIEPNPTARLIRAACSIDKVKTQ